MYCKCRMKPLIPAYASLVWDSIQCLAFSQFGIVSGTHQLPLSRYCIEPAALEPANPKAMSIVSAGSRLRAAMAATAPKMPAVLVLWKPRWYASNPSSRPTRQVIS